MSIENEPHVICFVSARTRSGVSLMPCRSSAETPGTIDKRFAIYPDRATADANHHLWGSSVGGYFSVPASALFNVEEAAPLPPPPPVFKPKFG